MYTLKVLSGAYSLIWTCRNHRRACIRHLAERWGKSNESQGPLRNMHGILQTVRKVHSLAALHALASAHWLWTSASWIKGEGFFPSICEKLTLVAVSWGLRLSWLAVEMNRLLSGNEFSARISWWNGLSAY